MKRRKSDVAADGRIEEIARTARFVEKEEGWFFRTREGVVLGPYGNQFDAELSASILVAQLAQAEDGTDTSALIQRFMSDPANATISGVERRDLMSKASSSRPARPRPRQGALYTRALKAIQRVRTETRI